MQMFYKLGYYINANCCYQSSYDIGIYAFGYKKSIHSLVMIILISI